MHTFTHCIHIPGTLAADINYRFKLPRPATLVHISAVGSNAAAAGLSLGTPADGAAYLLKCGVGVSNTPVEKRRPDFVGGQFPHLAAGDTLVAAVDYDYNGGGAGSASANLSLVLTFAEG